MTAFKSVRFREDNAIQSKSDASSSLHRVTPHPTTDQKPLPPTVPTKSPRIREAAHVKVVSPGFDQPGKNTSHQDATRSLKDTHAKAVSPDYSIPRKSFHIPYSNYHYDSPSPSSSPKEGQFCGPDRCDTALPHSTSLLFSAWHPSPQRTNARLENDELHPALTIDTPLTFTLLDDLASLFANIDNATLNAQATLAHGLRLHCKGTSWAIDVTRPHDSLFPYITVRDVLQQMHDGLNKHMGVADIQRESPELQTLIEKNSRARGRKGRWRKLDWLRLVNPTLVGLLPYTNLHGPQLPRGYENWLLMFAEY